MVKERWHVRTTCSEELRNSVQLPVCLFYSILLYSITEQLLALHCMDRNLAKICCPGSYLGLHEKVGHSGSALDFFCVISSLLVLSTLASGSKLPPAPWHSYRLSKWLALLSTCKWQGWLREMEFSKDVAQDSLEKSGDGENEALERLCS